MDRPGGKVPFVREMVGAGPAIQRRSVMQHRAERMSHPEVWRDVVNVLGRHSPLTFWRTSAEERPEFWWAIDADEDDVREDRVLGFLNRDDPLYFHSISSAVVFRQHPGNTEEPFP